MEQMAKPVWLKMEEKELKKIIEELAKKGKSSSQIGIILRDQYAVPTTKVFGKKLNSYLKELGIDKNEVLENAEKKAENLKEHVKNNVTDRKAKHKFQKAQSRVNVLKRHYSK